MEANVRGSGRRGGSARRHPPATRTWLAVAAALIALATIGSSFAASAPWSGTWRFKTTAKTSNPFYEGDTLTLVQKGTTVTGRFGFQHSSDKGFGGGFCRSGKGGFITGTASGRTLTAKLVWPARGGHPRTVAPFKATLSPSARTFHVVGQVTQGECANFGAYINATATRGSGS